MIRSLAYLSLAAVTTLAVSASEPLVGTFCNTKGKPVKGIKVYVHSIEDAVKSDKRGKFRIDNIDSAESIHVIYNKKVHSFAVSDQMDLTLVVGDDGRIFEKDSYVGETFHGHLVDYKGKPIRGAFVYANDPFDFVKSDRNGEFLIDNVVETDTLHIKHDGYIHDIAMDGSKGMFIKIMRATGRRIDDEFVNIGAGSVNLRDYNGSYSKLTAKQLEETGESNLLLAMRRMPGVSVYYKKDKLTISIRNSFWPPLWVVDGVEMTDFPDLTVMEVEKVEVLKDGANYGTRGGGGVIIVTTKGSI